MNNLAKTTYLTLIQHSNIYGHQSSKMAMYHMFRCLGARLYSNETWMKSSCLVSSAHTQQKQAQIQNYSSATAGLDVGGKVQTLREKGVSKLKKLIVGDPLKSKNALRFNAIRLYLSCTNALICNEIQNYVTLPDSFSTWHRLVGLHMWMIMTRLVLEDKPGKMSRNYMINAFHNDVEQKITEIGDKMELRVRTEEVDHLHTQFNAALFAYDEGILNSDRELAGALWRMLFMQKEDIDPHELEIMVQYIRKNVKLIHNLDRNHLLANGLIPFLPIEGDSVSQESYDMLQNVAQSRLKNK